MKCAICKRPNTEVQLLTIGRQSDIEPPREAICVGCLGKHRHVIPANANSSDCFVLSALAAPVLVVDPIKAEALKQAVEHLHKQGQLVEHDRRYGYYNGYDNHFTVNIAKLFEDYLRGTL